MLEKCGGEYIPGKSWPVADAADWSRPRLEEVSRVLSQGGSTALMVVESGRPVFQWGDAARKSSVASVRKSLLNILYGIFIAEGQIDPAATLADLEIDDVEPLTEPERRATVADLLKARSGVYHPAVYGTDRDRPARGSHSAGEFFFYNNWDFNVLATVLERQTGIPVFKAFAERVAASLGMEDFDESDCRYQHGSESCHPVYKMRLSARDLARVGLLYLRSGLWGEHRIVPESWVRESTRPHSDLGLGRGYGYLWWTADSGAPGDGMSVPVPLFYASGYGGQYIIVMPALDLVVVHRAADVDNGITHERMGEILHLTLAAMPRR